MPQQRQPAPSGSSYSSGPFSIKTGANNSAPNAIRDFVRKEITKAKKGRYWFRLRRMDRFFLNLIQRLRVKLESYELLRALVAVLKRLKEMGDRSYLRLKRGFELAWAFSEAAVSWGNQAAKEWRSDMGYVEYLGRSFLPGTRF